MEPPVATRSRRTAALLLDFLVVVVLLAILGLPLAATVAAAHSGVVAIALEDRPPPLPPSQPAPALRDLPIFTPGGDGGRAFGEGRSMPSLAALREELDAAARRVVGESGADEFWNVLALSDLGIDYFPLPDTSGESVVPYPFRYPYL